MHHPIDSAPKNGELLILEDNASGTYGVAYWATDRGEWVGKNGAPSKIFPTHWLSIEQDKMSSYAPIRKRAARAPPRRLLKMTALISVGLIGAYLFVSSPPAQQETAPTSTSLGPVVERQSDASTNTAAVRQNTELDAARQQLDAQDRRVTDPSAGEPRQSLAEDLRREALRNELAAARRGIEARDSQIEARDRQLRDQESELASVRRDVETKVALLTELQQQHDTAETLAGELATTREAARQAIEVRDSQIEARDRQLRDHESELASVRRDVETKVALLTELQQRHDTAETLAAELATTRESLGRAIETRDSQIEARDRQLHDHESELASVRRDVETKLALLTELRQQHDKAETLAGELATTCESVERAIETRDSQIEARDRQLRDHESELASVRRDIETKVTLLTELQQQNDRAETLAGELATTESAQRDHAQVASERSTNKVPIPSTTQTVAAAPPDHPANRVIPALAEPGPQPTPTALAPKTIQPDALLKNRGHEKQAEKGKPTRKELRAERRQRYAEHKARRKQRFHPTLSEPGMMAFYGGRFFGNYGIAVTRLRRRGY